MDNILLLNNQKLIVAEFNISINETTKFIISFRFVHKWQIQKVLNCSFLISIQYVNFYRRTIVNVAKDTRVVRKVCGHRDLRKNDCVFWKKTYVLSNDCLSKKQMILIFFKIYSDHYFAWIRYTENHFAYSRRQVTSNNWKANMSPFFKRKHLF